MIIKELNLIGFGKFKNKKIHLKEGINIIYGENEDGKTTIHNFINGMFYGFLKPYAKRTSYLDEYNRYEPWDNSRYSGIIKFSFEGEDYRIQREFTKNSESTQILLDSTGEDITNSIDNGGGGRILQPGNHFFGFNHGVYGNTISIKQLENKTEEFLANEVRDKLINISTSLDDDLSVENAINKLEKAIKDIGTTRAGKSLYGSIQESLMEDKAERENILGHREQYILVLEEKEGLEENLKAKSGELEVLKSELEDGEILGKKKLYREALSLEKDIKIVQDKVDAYGRYKVLDNGDYLNTINIRNKIENLKEKKLKYEENLDKSIERKKVIGGEIISNFEEEDEVIQKFLEYEKLEDEKYKEEAKEELTHLEFLKRDFENNKRVKDKYQSTLGIAAFVVLVSIVGMIFLDNFLFVAINFVSIPLGIFSFVKFKKSKEIVNKLKEKILQGQVNKKNIKENLETIERKQKMILNSLGLGSKAEFNKLQQDIRFKIYSKDEKEKSLKILRDEILELERDIGITKEEIDLNDKELKEILENNLSSTIKELEEGLKYKKIYDDSLLNLKNKEEVLNRILDGKNIEDLSLVISSYKKEIAIGDNHRTIDDIKKDIDLKLEEISNIKIQRSGVEERLNYLNNRIEKLVEVEESIYKKDLELAKLDHKRQALELARDTIKKLSKNIHNEFAPKINETVGEIVEKITGGKYVSVKVDDKLEIGIIKPDTGELINMKSLSGGTVDQLYFSLRFGIIDSLSQKALPLFLDDCFIQYDNKRLANMMKFLIDISSERQVVLFTCHDRELENLRENNTEFNLIDLSLF